MQKMTTNVGVVSQAYISPCSRQRRLSLMILGVVKFTTHYCFTDGEAEGTILRGKEREREKIRFAEENKGIQIEKDSFWLCWF